MRLDGKTVLVTGAGSGIGRALALEAAARGASLVLAGRRPDPLQQTADMIGADAPARVVVADIATAAGRHAIVEALGGAAGRLDVLVNNAGTLTVGPLSALDDAGIERMVATNLAAPAALTRDCLPLLRLSRGRVVNVGSMFGDIAYPLFAVYSATKFGLRGLSDALRRELAPQGIGVTHVAPRATRTDALSSFERLIAPFAMKLDTAEAVARRTWSAVERDARSVYPTGMEPVFVLLQRLFPALLDSGIGRQLGKTDETDRQPAPSSPPLRRSRSSLPVLK